MTRHMHAIALSAKRTLQQFTDAVWPGRSLVSGLPARGALSAEDFAALKFITSARCTSCGQPLEVDLGPDGQCGACIAKPPLWTHARAALEYDEVSRIPILALKRAGRRDGLKVMANWMITAGADLIDNADIIIPVPLHYRRLVSRGYNQAGWLAGMIGKQVGKPTAQTLLKRTRATPSQANLSPRARHRNVAGAFQVDKRKIQRIKGKNVLLIDDVLTTGATLKAATKALKQAGAEQIYVIVLARVVRATDITL